MHSPEPQIDTPRRNTFPRFSPPLSNAKNNAQRRPHAYVHYRCTTAQRTKKPKEKKTSYQRLEDKTVTRRRLLFLLRAVGSLCSLDVAEKLERCGSKFIVLACKNGHPATRQPLDRCQHRLCPHCAERRRKDLLKKYLPRALAFVRHSPVPVTPCHLVLTLTYREGETIREAKKRLYTAFRKLIRRDFWLEHFAGGLYSIEATLSEATLTQKAGMWHCHLHALVFRKKFFDVARLKEEWLSATGDSHVLRLDFVTDVESGLREVLKYISKPADFAKATPEHVRQLLELKGERMVGAFGEFLKFCKDGYDPSDNEAKEVERFDFDEGDCCPRCEEPLFRVVLTERETLDFYKRLERSRKEKKE